MPLNSSICGFQSFMHRLDILNVVELVAVLEIRWEGVPILQGQRLGGVSQEDILVPHAITRVSIVVLLFFHN